MSGTANASSRYVRRFPCLSFAKADFHNASSLVLAIM
jgi:hypothetical protein